MTTKFRKIEFIYSMEIRFESEICHFNLDMHICPQEPKDI